MIAIDLLAIGLSTATYGVIVWCSIRIWLYMRESLTLVASGASVQAAKTRAMATQLNVVLVVQALTPLCLELVPTIFLAGATLAKYPTRVPSSLMTLFLNWAPLVNALSVMIIVKPYRRVLVRYCAKRSGRTLSVSAAMSGSGAHSRRENEVQILQHTSNAHHLG